MANARVTISSAAQSVMVSCFRENLTDEAIAARIKAETGEAVAVRTIGRRKSEWKSEMERRKRGREQMEDLLAAMKSGDHTASEMVNALAVEALMRDPDGALMADPIALQNTSIAAERVRLQREQVELKRRQLELDESKFRAQQERERRALAAIEDGEKNNLSSDEVLRQVQGIYGVNVD